MKLTKAGFFLISLLLVAYTSIGQTIADSILVISIDAKQAAQTIHNIGASGCWFSEGIGRYWPAEKKEKIAELLFSNQTAADGSPKGIGLSAWRFNIGGGTAEQGDSSGIKNPLRRVECFLNPDGTYNWNKQAGYQWFLRKAKAYGVENLIAFCNTPPVQFTENGRGFKTAKNYRSNLKAGSYLAYADFLTTVIKHFDSEGLHFSYISPVNEPQWDWFDKPGEATQEGSPWTNAEIYNIVNALNSSIDKKGLNSQILTTEAGMLTYLYSGKSAASRQIQNFYTDTGRYSFNKFGHVPRFIAGHSYFTDAGDSSMVSVRKQLADTIGKYGIAYWESEYCMLGDGFREGTKEKRSQIDCALFLAKIINRDITVGNASAWQFWNAYEPGSAEWDTRYYLIALKPNQSFTDGEFAATKNLWAVGNYSFFVRPGMHRLITTRNDKPEPVEVAQDIMVSAFSGGKNKLVIVAINYTDRQRMIMPKLKNFGLVKHYKTYITTANPTDNLKASALQKFSGPVGLPPRSVTTIVFDK